MKLICVICRCCKKPFCVCQRCWRGQAYCSDACRRAGYLQSHRKAQHRYRQTENGKKVHRLAENRRRQTKLFSDSKNMDDGTSKYPWNMKIGQSCQEIIGYWNRIFLTDVIFVVESDK